MSPAVPSASSPFAVRRRVARSTATLLTPLLLVPALAACDKGGPDPSTFPDSGPILAHAAEVFADISTVHLLVDIEPPLGTLVPIAGVDIALTAEGESQGEAQIVLGAEITAHMINTADGRSFLDIGQGWFETDMLSSAYDTTAILDPDRGIAKLLATATDTATVGSERVAEAGNVDAWRITATLSSEVIEALVPADIPDNGITGVLWIAKDTGLLVKSVINVAETDVSRSAVIAMTLTDFNAPVTISDPTT